MWHRRRTDWHDQSGAVGLRGMPFGSGLEVAQEHRIAGEGFEVCEAAG